MRRARRSTGSTAVKQVLGDFLSRRKGDRVGVVVFGDAPFALVPFTDRSRALPRMLLDETAVGMAGPRTAFGDAIGLGIGAVRPSSTVKAKTIIALTDGNDTASKVPPAEAAGVAKDKGIVIHTVAVGDPAAAGEDKLDEAALKDVAAATGGGFFRALDRAQLARHLRRLDADRDAPDRHGELPAAPRHLLGAAARGAASALLAQALRLLRGAAHAGPAAGGGGAMIDALAAFHFERPLWLLCAAAGARRSGARAPGRRHRRGAGARVIDPELLRHLLVGGEARRALTPARLLLLVAWIVATSPSPGPAWQREPSPFADAKPPVVVVLKVTPSMMTPDLAPTRLDRARQKLADLLAAREGAATGLVAYAGLGASRPAADAGQRRRARPWPRRSSPQIMPKEGDDLAGAAGARRPRRSRAAGRAARSWSWPTASRPTPREASHRRRHRR